MKAEGSKRYTKVGPYIFAPDGGTIADTLKMLGELAATKCPPPADRGASDGWECVVTMLIAATTAADLLVTVPEGGGVGE